MTVRKYWVAFMFIAIFCCSANAYAAPVEVTYTTTSLPGNYVLNFTVTNNISSDPQQYVYQWGVSLPYDASLGSPEGFTQQKDPFNSTAYGGSGLTYNDRWADYSFNQIIPGASLSGFTIHVSSLPETISFYAFAYDKSGIYTSDHNPLFEGVAVESKTSLLSVAQVPEPVTLLLLGLGFVGLAGIRRFGK